MPASRRSSTRSTLSETTAKEMVREVRPPAFIETVSLAEVARLACALERAPLPLFAFRRESNFMIATQVDIFLGVPVFYFAFSNVVKHFLSYKTTAVGEEISLQDSPGNPTFLHAPVIEIVRVPKIFENGLSTIGKYPGEKFLSIQVKDLASLVKVASYKIMFEEPPLPIFAFPKNRKDPSSPPGGTWRLGSFTRIEEYEEASIFFFYEQEGAPEQNFVKSSMTKVDASFTNRTDELGSLYVKIIRLTEPHPLVELD